MIKIGDFSKLALISVRMLHHYEKMGLLMPVFVDKNTGYRYYDADQLVTTSRISALKDMGISLATIKDIIKQDSVDSLYECLVRQKATLIEQKFIIDDQISMIDSSINELNSSNVDKNYTVILKEIPKRYVVSVHQVIESYNAEGKLWAILQRELDNQKVRIAYPTLSCAIFHDDEYRDNSTDVEIQMSVDKLYDSTNKVTFKEMSSVVVASTIFEGGYHKIGKAMKSLVSWIDENNYEITGSMFNVYHVSPGQSQDNSQWITEVCLPIRKQKLK